MKFGAATLAVLALLAPNALAESSQTPAQAPPPEAPSPPPSPPGRLHLPYGNPYVALPSDNIGALRFESTVEVYGHAKRDPNEALALILKDALSKPSIYRGVVGPPKPPNTVNLIPLFEWLAKKIKSGRQHNNRD